MDFDICFLDGRGRLNCLVAASFPSSGDADLYARDTMELPAGNDGMRIAEIYDRNASPFLPLRVLFRPEPTPVGAVLAAIATRQPCEPAGK